LNENIRKPLIGMLRQFKQPNSMALAAALSANMLNCNFLFFNPEDIDLKNKKINGLVLDNGKWTRQISNYPDVVDNSPPRKENKAVYAELEKSIPFTMHRIGNKDYVSSNLIKDDDYKDLVIPYQTLTSEHDIYKMLELYKKIIVKPTGGNRGNGILYIEQVGQTYIVISKDQKMKYEIDDFNKYISKLIKQKYIIQKYISSTTQSKLPFDIRIHVRRGEFGKWEIVKIYPRIGNSNSVESNLSQGGSISKITPFLKQNFQDDWEKLLTSLNKLGKEFPIYFNKKYDFEIDALGLDIGIDNNGKLWLFEVNSFPGCTMFEIEAQQVAMKYAKYLAGKKKHSVINQNNNKTVIAMFSPAKGLSKLKTACFAAASMYDAEFCYFTPEDIDYKSKVIYGKTFTNNKWITKQYSYVNEIDVIYDRVRMIGRRKYKEVYEELNHIPFTHKNFGRTLNKIKVYDEFQKDGSMKNHIIPYIHHTSSSEILDFINEHKKIIIKPQVGLIGNGLYYIESSDSFYVIKFKGQELQLNRSEFINWIEKLTSKEAYVVQKYINTRTKDNQPFDIRVHLMRGYRNKWEFVVILPRVGIEFEKITPMKRGGYVGIWEGFIKRNYGEESYTNINKEMKKISLDFTKKFEKLFQTEISEVGIDFAIDENGQIYLLEMNLRRPGFQYYEFDVAKKAIGYAKYLSEVNK